MKKEIIPSLLISFLCLLLVSGMYTFVVWGIGQLTPDKGNAHTVTGHHGKYYYANIAQSFTGDEYFWPRPSSVNYNAAGSGGSNKGPADSAYLKVVQARIDTFIHHNPTIDRKQIPSDIVTASGSGLDPDISVQAALIQIPRVAMKRHINEKQLRMLVMKNVDGPLWGIFGPTKVNVLQLNISLEKLTHQSI